MAETDSTSRVAISVCVPTDELATLRPVLSRLAKQTVARQIEIVVATPDAEAVRAALATEERFAAFRVVKVECIAPLGPPRAAGVRAATGEFVFLGETHSFADPGWAEALLARHAEGWSVVVPGIANGNPKSALSWAGLLLDYGGWLEDGEPGEQNYWPLNNSSVRRSALLENDEDLERGLSYGDQLLVALDRQGHRVFFEPTARLEHLNVVPFGAWIDERWVGGVLVARHRSRDWSLLKRLAYVAATPLIPWVLLTRVASRARAVVRGRSLSRAVLPAMFLGSVVQALGEAVGYSRLGSPLPAERRMTEYEIHKARYARVNP